MFYIAFITGLIGSFHCVGMCGPIAMMVPVMNRNVVFARLLYNLGRSVSYSIIGAVIGLMGWGMGFTAYQQGLSVAIGLVLLTIGLLNTFKKNAFVLHFPSLNTAVATLKKQMGIFIRYNSASGNFVLGMLNGLLPCGLVYVAVGGALTQADVISGAIYMFLFGLGTLPLMLTVGIGAQFISLPVRHFFTKLVPYFTIFVACVLIMRGLNLGIPYLSPIVKPAKGVNVGEVECH